MNRLRNRLIRKPGAAAFLNGGHPRALSLNLCYPLTEDSGSVNPSDKVASSSGKILTVNNATWNRSPLGGPALLFNGTTAYATRTQSPNTPVGSAARTVFFRFVPNSVSARQSIVSWGSQGSTRQSWLCGIESTGQLYLGTWADDLVGSTALTAGTLYDAAYTYDGNVTIKVYLNGVPDGTRTLGGLLNSPEPGNGVIVGAWQATPTNFFSGLLDFFWVYGKELSAAQVMALHSGPFDFFSVSGVRAFNTGAAKSFRSSPLDGLGAGGPFFADPLRC